MSYDAAQEAQQDKMIDRVLDPPHKVGWSPEGSPHKGIMEIKKHIYGYHKRRNWTANNKYSNYDIMQIVKA